MELVLIIFNQLVFMLILIMMGFLLVKTKLLNDEGAKSLTNIILYVSSPIIIISSYHSSFDMIKLKKLLMSFLIAVFIHVLFIVLTKIFKIKNPVDISAATLSNAAFMGVPLISAALGEEAVFTFQLISLLIYYSPGLSQLKYILLNKKSILTTS